MNKNLKEQIIKLRNENKTYNEIALQLNCSKGTISFHLSDSSKQKQYHRQSVNKAKFKIKLKESLGGKCKVCNYSRCLAALDFHHLNPDNKKFDLGQADRRARRSEVLEEVKKCILLCANCHRELHDGFIKL